MFLKRKKQKVHYGGNKRFSRKDRKDICFTKVSFFFFNRRDDKHKPWEKADYDSEKTEKDRNAKNFVACRSMQEKADHF
jgi:hypothetical protein